jgi:phage terminase small subunit
MPRIRKPLSEKKADGTYRKDRDEPAVDGIDPKTFEPPKHLDTVARKFWVENVRLLHLAGLLKDSDTTTFALCCSAYSDFIRWSEVAANSAGMELDDQLRAQRQKNQQMKTFLDFAKALGLTAVDRGKVRGEGKQEADPFAEFLT